MTNEEMIAWANFPGTPDADFNTVKYHEAIKRLIWIAQKEARTEVWKMISETTKQNHDMEACESYPGGFFARKKISKLSPIKGACASCHGSGLTVAGYQCPCKNMVMF